MKRRSWAASCRGCEAQALPEEEEGEEPELEAA